MIGLVDCNNFYASCERLFQPKLRNRAVIVLSNNDGCVVARSDEAKALGIEMGAPAFQMQDIIERHNIAVFSSNYTLYGALSNRVITTLATFSPDIEVYSIDEAFLDLSGMQYLNLEKHALQMRQAVTCGVGIPISVGVAASKTLAKMANRFAKKTKKHIGVHILDSEEKTAEVLRFTQVEDIWGVGRQYAKLLRSNGFNTAYDLSKAPEEWVRKSMTVVGQRMWKELQGIPCIAFEETPPAKKNVCIAKSFGQLLTRQEDLQEALANYTAMAARKVRVQHTCASAINIFLQTNFFRTQDKQYSRSISIALPVATNDTAELLHYARRGLDRIFKKGYNFKRVGVMLLGLVPETQVQLGMFDKADREKNEKLMKVMDMINGKAGEGQLVKFAVQGTSRKWKLRQERLSRRYTTRLTEVLHIKVGGPTGRAMKTGD